MHEADELIGFRLRVGWIALLGELLPTNKFRLTKSGNAIRLIRVERDPESWTDDKSVNDERRWVEFSNGETQLRERNGPSLIRSNAAALDFKTVGTGCYFYQS